MKSQLIAIVAAVLVVGCGPDKSTSGPDKSTRYEAIWSGDIEVVKQHLAARANVNRSINDNEWTPLHLAALKGQKEIAELLIAEGADVNARDDDGESPLHFAAYDGRNEITELLITAGAEVNANSDDDGTPLDLAIRRKHHETADLLRKYGGRNYVRPIRLKPLPSLKIPLTKCKACSEKVSIEAETCPHCGQPNPAKREKN